MYPSCEKSEQSLCCAGHIKNVEIIRRSHMNTIIKNIEDAQLKAEVPAFNVGDTVRVSAIRLRKP